VSTDDRHGVTDPVHADLPRTPVAASELLTAIEQDQLVLHYHPVIDLDADRVTGVEALVRWQHPLRGLLQPAHFIAFAEESGLIVELGDWVLRRGAAQASAWAAAGRVLDVAINLSPVQMSEDGFAERCSGLLAEATVPTERIVLEVTESALFDHPAAADVLTQVRNIGVRLALDDFGTGYSSFTYLRRFPIDIIKIDQSFVAGLDRHPDDDAIVASIVGLARRTGKSLIAEGVESDRQLSVLTRLGVQAAQGFLWTPPLAAAQVERWIDSFDSTRTPRTSAAVAKKAAGAVCVPGSVEERRILQLHADGASLHTIAAALNGEGLRTSAGLRWHVRSVMQVIAPSRSRVPA